MTTNNLVELMKEYGVKVEMMGEAEDPNPTAVALAGMLLEIHTLRARLSAARQTQPTDEELANIFADALEVEHQKAPAVTSDMLANQILAGTVAVRAALTAPVPQVQIPEWVEEVVVTLLGDMSREPECEYGRESTGYGPTWQEALAAACERAGGTDASEG